RPGIDAPGFASRSYSPGWTSDEAQLPTPRIAFRTLRRDRESLRTLVLRGVRPLCRLPFFVVAILVTPRSIRVAAPEPVVGARSGSTVDGGRHSGPRG